MTQQQHPAHEQARRNLALVPEAIEQEFWSQAPADSQERMSLLPPDFPDHGPSRLRVWGARLLFVVILSAIGAIAALAVMAMAKTGQRPDVLATPARSP